MVWIDPAGIARRDVAPARSGSLSGGSPFVWILMMDRLDGLDGLDQSGGGRDARGGGQRRRSRDDRMMCWIVAGSWSSKSSWVTRGRRAGRIGAGGSERT